VLKRKRIVKPMAVAAVILMVASVLFGFFSTIANAAPPPLTLDADSYILIDYATGKVLAEKNADAAISPASLTKLMTLHIAWKKLAEGAIKPTDKVQIRTDAWSANMPGSSVMFLAPGQNVTVAEVMKGLAIPSGNDAAIALADHISGSVDAFVALMNQEAQAMGYKTLHFVDPSGLSPGNKITAREFADFCRRYIQMHPQALTELHSVKTFSYPLWENLSPDEQRGKTKETYQPITQNNRNGLLWSYEGVDGLKTGFIDESGYNLAVTAQRGDMRLVGVILGVHGRDEAEGSRKREADGAAMLTWGFNNFVTVKPPVGDIAPVKVYKGTAGQVTLEPAQPVALTVEKGLENKITRTLHEEATTIAPVKKGDKLGELIYAADGKEIARVNLVAANDVPQGGFFKRLWDTIIMKITSLLHRKK